MARFLVSYTFQGRSSEIVEAETQEDADEKINQKIEAEDFFIDADEIDDVDFTLYRMHPVVRDGKEIWTTYLKPSDQKGHPSSLQETPLFSGAPEAA